MMPLKKMFLRQMAKIIAGIASVSLTLDMLDLPIILNSLDEIGLALIIVLMIPVNAILKKNEQAEATEDTTQSETTENVVEKPQTS